VALATALDYVTNIGIERIASYENELLEYATSKLLEIPDMRIIGTAAHKCSVISFVIAGIHPFDLGTLLDKTVLPCVQEIIVHNRLSICLKCLEPSEFHLLFIIPRRNRLFYRTIEALYRYFEVTIMEKPNPITLISKKC